MSAAQLVMCVACGWHHAPLMPCPCSLEESDASLPDAFVTVYDHPGTPTTFGGAYSSEKNAQGMARTGGGRAVRYVPLARVELATRLAMLDEAREAIHSPAAFEPGFCSECSGTRGGHMPTCPNRNG